MMRPSIIGFGGLSGAGKDSAAEYLCDRYGYRRRGFADALKEEVARNFRLMLAVEARRVYGHQLVTGVATLDECIHRLLWTERTELTRALLQNYGSEVRRGDDPAYWTTRLFRILSTRPDVQWVVPDVRFENELLMLRRLGACLMWVERPGVSPASSHASENSLSRDSGWDAHIINDGKKEALYAKLDSILAPAETRPALLA